MFSHSAPQTSDHIYTRARNLKKLRYLVRSGESILRPIDISAAEYCFEFFSEYESLQNVCTELAFDLTLVLSFVSSQGRVGLSAQELYDLSHLMCFHHPRALSDDSQQAPEQGGQLEELEVGEIEAEALKEADKARGRASSQPTGRDAFFALLDQLAQYMSEIPNHTPITCQGGLWYLGRHWQLRKKVDEWYNARLCVDQLPQVDDATLAPLCQHFSALFSGVGELDEIDFQALAAAQSLLMPLTLVSGGPGTGKTTTAARMLILNLLKTLISTQQGLGVCGASRSRHQSLSDEGNASLFALCLAPTGKAAQRLHSSLRGQALSLIERLSIDQDCKRRLIQALPSQGLTIHRFLIESGAPMDELSVSRWISDNERIFEGDGNTKGKSPAVVVVDESSMIDLALMERLVSVLPSSTSVIFLGDHDQLPPVEAGEVFRFWVGKELERTYPQNQLSIMRRLYGGKPDVFSELVQSDASSEGRIGNEGRDGNQESNGRAENTTLQPLARLRKTYRFAGPLADLANAVRGGTFAELEQVLNASSDESVTHLWITERDAQLVRDQQISGYQDYFKAVASGANLAELQNTFDRFQTLCSTRLGELGSIALSAQVEQALRSTLPAPESNRPSRFYHGCPIMVEANYPYLDIFNGDIGFVIEEAGRFSIQFYREDSPAVVVPPHKIERFVSAFAITIHKSQGSEYDHVSVVLAPYAAELLSRSLLYTGITRAKRALNMALARESLPLLLER